MNNQTLTRRSVLQGLGAASLTAAAPGLLHAKNQSKVLIIGAGLSGLGAALLLQDAGIDVLVVSLSKAQHRMHANVEDGFCVGEETVVVQLVQGLQGERFQISQDICRHLNSSSGLDGIL